MINNSDYLRTMIYNAPGVACQLRNFCFEHTTPYTHFSAFKYSKYSYCWQWEWEGMGIEMCGKMGMRH